ncbi:hypothetical protein [Acrocarpospora macrocephala]|uniref:hypothetical protein n=1 Tax=Acrocarpospora macrocephala TaxID=150177 RepID=UPI0012D2B83B
MNTFGIQGDIPAFSRTPKRALPSPTRQHEPPIVHDLDIRPIHSLTKAKPYNRTTPSPRRGAAERDDPARSPLSGAIHAGNTSRHIGAKNASGILLGALDRRGEW